MQKERAMEKIKKLLELGNSPNQAEAELALKRAGELMAKYGIGKKDIENGADDNGIIREDVNLTEDSARLRWEPTLINTIAKCFDCKVVLIARYYRRRRVNGRVAIIGDKADIELVVHFYKYLRRSIGRGSEVKFKTIRDRYSYCIAAINAIRDRLQIMINARKRAVDEDGTWGLVLAKQKKVDEAFRKEFPYTRMTRTNTLNGSRSAWLQGAQAGKNIPLSTPIGGQNGGSQARLSLSY